MSHEADAIVVGRGLAGLVATAELTDAGRRVIVIDQEPEGSLEGQAFWSLRLNILTRKHGYRALEGTFLGGCMFSGRTAGRAVAAAA